MERYLFLARSITHAQQMQKVLERARIYTKIRRAGAKLTGRGCGYSLDIATKDYEQAQQVLQMSSLKPVKVIYTDGKEQHEVSL